MRRDGKKLDNHQQRELIIIYHSSNSYIHYEEPIKDMHEAYSWINHYIQINTYLLMENYWKLGMYEQHSTQL